MATKIEKLKTSCNVQRKVLESLFTKLENIVSNENTDNEDRQKQLRANIVVVKKKIAALEESDFTNFYHR